MKTSRKEELELKRIKEVEEEAEMNTIIIKNKNKNKHVDHDIGETNHGIITCRGHHLYQEALKRKQRLEEKLKGINDDNDKQRRTPKASREELERLAHQRYMKAEEYKTRLSEKRLNKMKSEQEEIGKAKLVFSQGRFFDFDYSSVEMEGYERYRTRFESMDSNEKKNKNIEEQSNVVKKTKKTTGILQECQLHSHLKHGNIAAHPARVFEAKSIITKKTNEGTHTSSSNSTSSSGSRCGAAVSSRLSRIQASERLTNLYEQGRLKLLARNNIHNRRARSNLVVVDQRGFPSRLHSMWRPQNDIGKSRRMAIEQRLAENKTSLFLRFV